MADEDDEAIRWPTEEFFAHLGYAIARWAYVDRALFKLCQYSLNTSEEKTAVVFYRSPQIGEHLVLVDRLMMITLNKQNATRWKAIFKMIENLLPFRNGIAHNPAAYNIGISGLVIGQPAPESGQSLPEIETSHWWTIRTEPKKLLRKSQKQFEITKDDLIEHIKNVDHLLEKMKEMTRLLPKRLSRKPSRSSRSTTPQASDSKSKSPHNPAKPQSRPRSSRE